jgi:hypothetical protein
MRPLRASDQGLRPLGIGATGQAGQVQLEAQLLSTDLLRSELHDLKFSGFDLDLIGFEPDRLDEILAGLGSGGLSDPDSIPDVPDQPVTGPGEGDQIVCLSHEPGRPNECCCDRFQLAKCGGRPELRQPSAFSRACEGEEFPPALTEAIYRSSAGLRGEGIHLRRWDIWQLRTSPDSVYGK